VWQVGFAFFGNEFQDASVGGLRGCAVVEGEEHGVGNVEAGEFVEGAGGEEDLAACVGFGAVLGHMYRD
jgi:hypothetical protein